MISLYESELHQLLPEYLKKDLYVQAFSYAIDKQIRKLLERCKRIQIWSNLNEVDEYLLDYLAVELRTQYYSTELDAEIKRKLVSNTLLWYQKAGTVAAVEELVRVLFGEGSVKEWYEYEGLPHHFQISTTNPNITGDILYQMNFIIEQIKRKTAKLDTVEISLSAIMNAYYGFKMHTGTYVTLRQEG